MLLKDYLPVFAALIAVFITVLLYDYIQQKLAAKSKKANALFNLLVIIGIFVLIGVLFYLLLAVAASAVTGTNQLYNSLQF